jgi:hypothetical protein
MKPDFRGFKAVRKVLTDVDDVVAINGHVAVVLFGKKSLVLMDRVVNLSDSLEAEKLDLTAGEEADASAKVLFKTFAEEITSVVFSFASPVLSLHVSTKLDFFGWNWTPETVQWIPQPAPKLYRHLEVCGVFCFFFFFFIF